MSEKPATLLTDEAQPQKALNKHKSAWLLGALILFLVLLVPWLRLTPEGFWGKLHALGYSVCHQIPGRSIFVGGHQAPLCARCMGMYLAAAVAIFYQLFQGRRQKFPSLPISLTLLALFLWFGVDGINSLLSTIPGLKGIYEPSNTLRLLTGMGVGLGIGAVIVPLFHQVIWKQNDERTYFKPEWKFLLLLLVLGLLAWGILSNNPFVLYPVFILSGLAVFFLLSLVYTIVAVMLLRRENRHQRWQELLLPALLGMSIALLQIALFSFVRFWLTGGWGSINL